MEKKNETENFCFRRPLHTRKVKKQNQKRKLLAIFDFGFCRPQGTALFNLTSQICDMTERK
jgi:hypothetical protein